MFDDCTDAMQEGAAAFEADEPDACNPYDRETQPTEWRHWHMGWSGAAALIDDGSDFE